MELSDRIKKERNKLNLSQDALANELHVSRQAISKWETGQSYPDLEKLIQLSNIFEVTIDELVKGDKELEKKLINDGGNQMRGLSILSYVLIIIGVFIGFWGGSMFPISLINEDFMTFLTSTFIVITIMGILLIKDIQKHIVISSLFLTTLMTVIYMVSLKLNMWVLQTGIVVVISIVWWFSKTIIYKKFKLE